MIDDRDRRIVRQHSQEMAIRWLSLTGVPEEPTEDALTALVKKWTDHFDRDAYSTGSPSSASPQQTLGTMSDEEIANATGGTVTRVEERIASEKQQGLVAARAKAQKLTKGAVKKLLKEHAQVETLENLPMRHVDAVLEAIGR